MTLPGSSPTRARKELGLSIPSSESARLFLSAFHEEEPLKDRPEQGAFIPPETEALKRLLKIQEKIVARTHDHPTIATIDQDASVIVSAKDEARPTYLSPTGYQPVITYWAEKDMILADQFRDGNVPAAYDLLSSLVQSIEMLPDTVTEVRYRADSASYNHDLMNALRLGITISGRRIKVIFAISADMTESLRHEIEKLPADAWKPLRKVTNTWEWDGERLLRWHPEKCGTVEKVFDVLYMRDITGCEEEDRCALSITGPAREVPM